MEELGRLDIAVNDAAMAERGSLDMPQRELTPNRKRAFDPNLLRAVHGPYRAIAEIRSREAGRSSILPHARLFAEKQNTLPVLASKAALVNSDRCCHEPTPRRSILACAVATGFSHTGVDTEDITPHGDEIRSQIPS